MFNPYISGSEPELGPVSPGPKPEGGLLPGLTDRLGKLDRDDLLIGLLVYLLAREQEPEGIWPLVAAGLYFLL